MAILLAPGLVNSPAANNDNTIQPTADTVTPLTIEAHSATQSASLLNFLKSDGTTVLGQMTAAGKLSVGGVPAVLSGLTSHLTVRTVDNAIGLEIVNSGSSPSPLFRITNSDGNQSLNFFDAGHGPGFALNMISSSYPSVVNTAFDAAGAFTPQLSDIIQVRDDFSNQRFTVDKNFDVRFERPTGLPSDGICRIVAHIKADFLSNVDATWKGRLLFTATDFVAEREFLRGEADGATPRIGFLGGSAVVQQAGASAAGIAAITDANAKAAITALQNALHAYNLVTAPA